MRSLVAYLTEVRHACVLRELEILWFPWALHGLTLPAFPCLRQLNMHRAQKEVQLSLCARLPELAPQLECLSVSPFSAAALPLQQLSRLERLSIMSQCEGDTFPALMHGRREVTLTAPDSLLVLRMEVSSSYRVTVIARSLKEFTRLGFGHHGLRLECPRLQTCRLIWTEQLGCHLPASYFRDFVIHSMIYLRNCSLEMSRFELCLPSRIARALKAGGLPSETVPAEAKWLPRCCRGDDKTVVAFSFTDVDVAALKDPYLAVACPPQQPRELDTDYKSRVLWFYRSIPFFSRNAYGLKE